MSTERLQDGFLLGDRYEIIAVVGRGGMGTVYKARDTRLDMIVAVKEMNERSLDGGDSDTAKLHFEQEAKLLAQLSHGNLPRVSDYFVAGGRWYLIMEFVEGATLEAHARSAAAGPLPVLDVLAWGIQTAEVLHYLHHQTPPIVFRDVKPANIMLTASGAIKLIDFGIARRFSEGATKDTLLYGSPGYSPPEQYGRSQTDPRADIYALGATLHQLLTGRDPAATPFKFPLLRTLNPNLPQALEALLAKCVEMDEGKRMGSTKEVRDTLVHLRAAIAADPRMQRQPSDGDSPGGAAASPRHTGPKITSARLSQVEQRRTVRKLLLAAVSTVIVVAVMVIAVPRLTRRSKAPAQTVVKPLAPPPTLVPTNPEPAEPSSKPPTLRVASTPSGAAVSVEGRDIGVTPFETTALAAGRHVLQITAPEGSDMADATREIDLDPGATLELDTQLSPITRQPDPTETGPSAEIVRMSGFAGTVRSPLRPRLARNGILVTVSFRVRQAAAKHGVVSVFFYDKDGSPMRPVAPRSPYQNADGQLSAARAFVVKSSPADFPEFELFVPAQAFPTTDTSRITYRLVVFVDGKAAATSEPQAVAAGP